MTVSDNCAVVTRFLTEVWNNKRTDALDDFLDPAYYDFTYEPRNREGHERVLALMQAAYPDHETIIEEIVGQGDTVAVCLTLKGTHTGEPFRGIPATGKTFAIGGYRFFKLRAGKIVSHRGLIDLPSMLQQIGG